MRKRDNTRIRIRQCARIKHTLDDAPLPCNGIGDILDVADADEFNRDRLTREKHIGLCFHFVRHNHIAVSRTDLYLTCRCFTQVLYFHSHMEGSDRAEVLLYCVEYLLRRRLLAQTRGRGAIAMLPRRRTAHNEERTCQSECKVSQCAMYRNMQ